MTGLALAHYAAAALFVAAGIAHATGLAPGTQDAHVARFIAPDVIADDRSVLTLDGTGVRFVGQAGRESERQETPTPVPVPPALWLLAGAVGVLAIIGRKRK